MNNLLRIRDLCWRYPSAQGLDDRFAIKGINLEIGQNEFFGITGRSDSGKSTLCSAIAGLIPDQFNVEPDRISEFMRGSVEVCGKIVTKISGKNSITINGSSAPIVGLVSQDPEGQFLTMSVEQELSLGLHFLGIDDKEITKRVKHALCLVGLSHLYGVMDKVHPSELSGGQKQRMVIASFLAMRPKLLILDETTSDLDSKGKLEVIETIHRIKKDGEMSVILVEQDSELMLRFADRLGVMNGGRMVAVGKPHQIYADRECITKYGISTTPVARLLATRRGKILVEDSEILRMFRSKVRKNVFKVPEGKRESFGDKIIESRDLCFSYGDGTIALMDVNLTLRRGEFVAFLGQNGSGKSTLLRLIAGMEAKFDGELTAFDFDLSSHKNRNRMPYHIGYIFQNPEVQIFNRSVYEEVAYGPRNLGMSEREIKPLVNRIIVKVGLSAKINEDPMFLSRGQKRRLAVASVIAMGPKLIIVDEPTTGQDTQMSRNIMELLKELNRSGTSVIVVTHDIQLASEYCSRAVVMNHGSIEFDGKMSEMLQKPTLLELTNILVPQIGRIGSALEKTGLVKGTIVNSTQLSRFMDELGI